MLSVLGPASQKILAVGGELAWSRHGRVRDTMIEGAQYRRAQYHQDGMALFGLVWLLRVRGSQCDCASCSRDTAGDDISSREEEDALEGPSYSGDHIDPPREIGRDSLPRSHPTKTPTREQEAKEIPSLSRDTHNASRDTCTVSRDMHSVTREMLNISLEGQSSSCEMYSSEIGSGARESIGMQTLGEVMFRSERTGAHVAEVCVSTVQCETGAGGYQASGLYETVVTQDATVQTDFEDDDYEYETYDGPSEFGKFTPLNKYAYLHIKIVPFSDRTCNIITTNSII